MPNIVDRTGPRLDLLPNSAVNSALEFPYQVTPKNGYKAAAIQLVSGTPVEIYFRPNADINFGIGEVLDKSQLIFGWLVVGTIYVLITPSGLYSVESTTGEIDDDSFIPGSYSAGKTYMLRLRSSTDGVIARVYNIDTGEPLSATNSSITVTGVGGSPRDIILGFPTDAILAFEPYDSDSSTKPALDFTIIDVKAENPGPDEFLEVSPKILTALPRLTGSTFATVVGRHPRQYQLTYAKAPVQISPDGTYFTMQGNRLQTTAEFTSAGLDPSTIYSFSVRVYDHYGWSNNVAALMYTLPTIAPTSLTLDNNAVTEPDTEVGTLSVTSGMSGTYVETFTYTLVAGTGDTNNALFTITADALAFTDASAAGTYNCRVRATSNVTGEFVEDTFEITVSAP